MCNPRTFLDLLVKNKFRNVDKPKKKTSANHFQEVHFSASNANFGIEIYAINLRTGWAQFEISPDNGRAANYVLQKRGGEVTAVQ